MLKRTLPNWNDKAGVAKLASGIIAERNPFIDYGDYIINADEFFKFVRAEEAAVEAALHGDRVPLAKLLQGEHGKWLQPSTGNLIADILLGRHKRKRGGQKMTREKRLEKNPIHQAAIDFNVLRRRLQQLYPEQRVAAVRERAIEIIAAERTGVTSEALRHYSNRAENAPQRIK
jgi:hypothetical protein